MSEQQHDELVGKIRSFWDEQAEHFSGKVAATTNDPLIKQLELAVLTRVLDPEEDVLEAGCGNGNNLISLAGRMSKRLYGFDYSEQMINAAVAAANEAGVAGRTEFSVHDLCSDLNDLPMFKQIYTDRCLINLPTHEMQIAAVSNLASRLEMGGRLALVECASQPLDRLNELRAALDMAAIPQHWHNHYLDEGRFLAEIPVELKLLEVEAFSSLYYVASRVFNAALTPEDESPDYLAPINKLACRLPSFGDFGPHKLYLFEKVA